MKNKFVNNSIAVSLIPFGLFIVGFLSGTQFSLHNVPAIVIFSFAAFYVALEFSKTSLKRSLFYSISFGIGFFSYSHVWINHPLSEFEGIYDGIQPLVLVLVPGILSLYFVFLGWINYMLKVDGLFRIIHLSMATVFIEYLRCQYAPAVPLGQIGSIWITYPVISQMASVVGIYGLSLFTICVSYGIGAVMQNIRYILLPVTIAGICIGWGMIRLSNLHLELSDIVVRICPTSLAQKDKYTSFESRAEHLKQLTAASCKGISSNNVPDLIIWPETSIEFPLSQKGKIYDFTYPGIKTYLKQALPVKTTLLGGVVFVTANQQVYNTVFTLNAVNDIDYVYKKQFLAPFGEFMPLGLKYLAQVLGIKAVDNFDRGPEQQSQLELSNGAKINTLICYEGSFSGTVRRKYPRVDLFTISTNDAWFSHNGKEQQFISHAFRALEEGVPIIRCANNGFSGYVSPMGIYKISMTTQPMTFKPHRPLKRTFYGGLIRTFPYAFDMLFLSWVIYFIWGMYRSGKKHPSSSDNTTL